MNTLKKHALYIYPLLILGTSVIAIFIIIENYKSDTYDQTQDSIGLPIGSILAISLTLLVLYSAQIFRSKITNNNPCIRLLLNCCSFISASLSLALLSCSTIYWYIPNHISIGIAYTITTVAFSASQIALVRRAN